MSTSESRSIAELVRLCSVGGEADAWEEFVNILHRPIATTVVRMTAKFGDHTKQTVDDLIQETYLKLCSDDFRILRNFEEREADAFIGFVKIVTANLVRDHFKSRYSIKRGDSHVDGFAEDFVPAAKDGSLGSPEAIERELLFQEIQRHLEFCAIGTDEERKSRIFWLYYRAGLSASAIAALPGTGLTTKGVESLILRLTRELRERMAPLNLRTQARTLAKAEGVLPAESF